MPPKRVKFEFDARSMSTLEEQLSDASLQQRIREAGGALADSWKAMEGFPPLSPPNWDEMRRRAAIAHLHTLDTLADVRLELATVAQERDALVDALRRVQCELERCLPKEDGGPRYGPRNIWPHVRNAILVVDTALERAKGANHAADPD